MSTKSSVTSSEETKLSRRKFFFGASAAVGAVAVVSQTAVGKAVIREISSTTKEKSEGQSITAHMRKYYESTMI
jgi:hypothetical protein